MAGRVLRVSCTQEREEVQMRLTKWPLSILLVMSIAVLFASEVALAATRTCIVGVLCEGTDNADTITGTDQADEIKAKDGRDTVYGLEGGDTISGGMVPIISTP